MSQETTANLELSIAPLAHGWGLSLRLSEPDKRDGPFPIQLDLATLRALDLDAADYGAVLRDSLFATSEAATAFREYRAAVLRAGQRLRVRLVLPSDLHILRWERLLDPYSGRALALDGDLLLSRYLSSDDYASVQLRPRGQLRALIAVAAPADAHDYGLPSIDAAAETTRVTTALSALAHTVVNASWTELSDALRNGYDILYLVAHGKMNGGQPWLWLVDDQGNADQRRGGALADLLRSLNERRPRLVVLASCESAGDGYADTLAAFGPLLVQAGVPAVLAMQGTFSIATNERFAPVFFRELLVDNVIDKAINAARFEVAQDRPDWWIPVLYTRLQNGLLWNATPLASRIDISSHRTNSRKHVQRTIETHSRAIKPSGTLPVIRQRNVTVHHEGQHRRFNSEGALIAMEKSTFTAPFIDVACSSRNVLLLGDLGTGKTTLVCMLAEHLMKSNTQSLACIVPASILSHQNNLTVHQLLHLASHYFNSQISPNTVKVDFEDLLNYNVELCLTVDGLDEVAILDAARILNKLRDITEHWANVQVVATARPVELQGVNFSNWQVLSLATMSDAELMMLFEEEAIAGGKTRNQAQEEARNLQGVLKSLTALDSLANTPLIVRLLYTKLTNINIGSDSTLGDLLFDIVQERLGKWDARNQKTTAVSNFESAFPDELSKLTLLGRMAFYFFDKKLFSVEEAKYWLYNNLSDVPQLKLAAITKEAVDFYERSGLIIIVDGSIRFAIQPFFELLAGYGLAAFWRERVGQEIPSSFPWRIVSFAATVLRRFGVLQSFRDNLIGAILHTLLHTKNFPGASYVVTECKDGICASAFITAANSLGPRPIRLFSDEQEQSARAVAYSLKLAQQSGFDWFFDQYLDPRYPRPYTDWDAGSVFQEWAALSFGSVTPYEEERLKSLLIPHMKASTLQSLVVIPTVAILLPHLFDMPNRLWYAGRYLGQRRFSKQVYELFSEAFTQDSNTTNSVLIAIAEQGYENAASAAWLWLELNSDRQPSVFIVKTLIKEYGTRHINPDLGLWLQHCRLRVGEGRWRAFLRWCLSSEKDPNLPGGAAILLFAEGERSLSLLGIPLLRILHDGGHVRKAEENFDDLVQEKGISSLYFLSEQIVNLRSDDFGAFSGYWRLLLSSLPKFEQEGPQILAQSAGGVGCFLMARYPEVRQKFRDLLNGQNGTAYRNTLRARLKDFDATTRHGAAMILIVANPADDVEALEAVIRERSRHSSGSWFEWERFCLSLALGATALQSIAAKLSTFDSLGLVFALALLHRNRFKLHPENFFQLVEGLLDVENGSLDPFEPELSVLSSSQALPILENIVRKGKHKNVIRAAELLLEHHQSSITEELLVKSLSLTVDGAFWRINKLNEELAKIISRPSYANAIAIAAREIVQQDGQQPLLDLIREALVDERVWDQVVWRMVCNSDSLSRNYEYGGQWLIDFGRANTQYSMPIGQAAVKHFRDARLRTAQAGEPLQWLGVIAHEFNGISEAELLFALLEQNTVYSSAAQAIIARIGYTPSGFVQERNTGAMPELQATVVNREIDSYWAKLHTFAQQSDALHPLVCDTLEYIIFNADERFVRPPSFSNQGLFGALIDSAFAFAFEQTIDPKIALLIIPVLHERNQSDICLARLRLIWALQYNTLIEESEEERDKYIYLFDTTLSDQTDNYVAIAAELLQVRGYLTTTQAARVLDTLTTSIITDNFGLANKLVKWFSSAGQDTLSSLQVALERSVFTLDTQDWSIEDGLVKNPTKYFVVSLGYWRAFGRGSEESYRVFWRGLKIAFSQRVGNHGDSGPAKVLSRIEPLLAKVPRIIVEEAIASGLSSPDATVSSLARLFTFSSRLEDTRSATGKLPQ